MIAYNKINYCRIIFQNNSEIDFVAALSLPIQFNCVLDETLNTATIKLTDLRQDDYPLIDVSKPFEPFSLVKISFADENGNRQETEIRMVIAQDTCKMQRKDGTLWRSWCHTIQLVEETKIMERESVDVLTFTNPVERHYDATADAQWLIVEGNVKGLFADSTTVNLNKWELPYGFKMLYPRGTSIKFNNNREKFDDFYQNETIHGEHLYAYKRINYLNFFITYPTGRTQQLLSDAEDNINFCLDKNGEYILRIEFQWEHYIQNTVSYHYIYTYTFEIYIAAGNIENYIQPYHMSDVLERLLNVTPLKTKSEKRKYQFNILQLGEFLQEESPEFAFTGHTLFEAMLLIAGYKGAFPELKTDDSGNKTISFRSLCNDKYKTAAELPPPIDEIALSDINQYCTYLETEVQNLVGINNSRKATLIEPYVGGYKTTRSGAGSEISEDTVIIATDYNVYQSISLIMGETNGQTVGDISAYVYEQGDYESLSDTNGAYPNSKGYAIKWSQMGRNFTELAHRIYKVDNVRTAFERPAISNILYAITGDGGDASLMNYLAKLIGIKDKDTFAELMFHSEYVPIFNARVKQYKECFANFHYNGSIKYNQSAELVDSELYGEHLKQLIRKIGNATKRCVYIFDKIDDVPEVGTVVEGYSIYDVQMSIRENEVVATISYVKYAELSQYIGVKNAWKDSDVSTSKCYNRSISYNEFLLFTNDSNKQSTSNSLSENALNGLVQYSQSAPLTCVEATGFMDDGSELNTVLLPVVSLAMGNSLFFTWKYEDNYSAGYMSENAPSGATNALSGTKYNRAQKAVRYCDMYGRLETYSFKLLPTGPIPDGNIGWRKSEEEIDYSINYVARQIGYYLPLKPEELVGWNPQEYISVNDLLVEKNSSEALSFAVQLHYCSDNENFIVGSGLSNFCSLVGGEAQEVGLFGFNERINIFKRRFSVNNATRLADINFTVNSERRRIEIALPEPINDYQAWAFMGKDKNGNWQIIFGENSDLQGSAFKTELYLLPMHKLEDFI